MRCKRSSALVSGSLDGLYPRSRFYFATLVVMCLLYIAYISRSCLSDTVIAYLSNAGVRTNFNDSGVSINNVGKVKRRGGPSSL